MEQDLPIIMSQVYINIETGQKVELYMGSYMYPAKVGIHWQAPNGHIIEEEMPMEVFKANYKLSEE